MSNTRIWNTIYVLRVESVRSSVRYLVGLAVKNQNVLWTMHDSTKLIHVIYTQIVNVVVRPCLWIVWRSFLATQLWVSIKSHLVMLTRWKYWHYKTLFTTIQSVQKNFSKNPRTILTNNRQIWYNYKTSRERLTKIDSWIAEVNTKRCLGSDSRWVVCFGSRTSGRFNSCIPDQDLSIRGENWVRFSESSLKVV